MTEKLLALEMFQVFLWNHIIIKELLKLQQIILVDPFPEYDYCRSFVSYICSVRCVIVVGLPYPNVKSLELQEKLTYLNGLSKSETRTDSHGKDSTESGGHEYYETLCMRAVNQSIGNFLIFSKLL